MLLLVCFFVAMTSQNTSKRPYLIRAMHEWMSDNGYTPHIVVNADVDGLVVPEEHVSDGKIILNVSQSATKDLIIANQLMSFETRFACIPDEFCILYTSFVTYMFVIYSFS